SMTEPSGRIVARVTETRSCGHAGEFQHYERDPYRAQRLAKFRATRCPTCAAEAARANDQRQRAQADAARRRKQDAGPPPRRSEGRAWRLGTQPPGAGGPIQSTYMGQNRLRPITPDGGG